MNSRYDFLITLAHAVILITILTACSDSDFRKGHYEAINDLSSGKLQIRYFGDPISDSFSEENQIREFIRKEYRIDFIRIHGCGVSKKTREHTFGYNKVMQDAIQEKTGLSFQEILKKAYPDADRLIAIRF